MQSGDRLFESLYQELRRLARRQIRLTDRNGTLDTGALIHEAYLKLADNPKTQVRDRGHFLALASRVMRQVVVDYTRRKGALKRGAGRLESIPEGVPVPSGRGAEELLCLDRALERLEAVEPRLARLVDLRFFGGLSAAESAEVLEVSVATVHRDWIRAKAILYSDMSRTAG